MTMLAVFAQAQSQILQLLTNITNNWCGVFIAFVSVALAIAIHFLYQTKPKGCLDPKKFKEFKLIKRAKVSHNTDRFTFALPTPTSVLGLPVGQHIICKYFTSNRSIFRVGIDYEGRNVVRPYTPITLDSDIGYFELIVKMYPQGRMSHHFRYMRVGDSLPVKGPLGKFKYKPGQVKEFGMLAGGTGITPMFQLTRAILENPKDNTIIHLIFANHTVNDIILKDELDGFSVKYPDQFKINYIVTEPSPEWNGDVGYVTKKMIQRYLPHPGPDVMILRCGPPGMNKAMEAYLNELGYASNLQFQF